MLILTIGHSSHDWPHFQHLLDQHEIGCVADVRSYPRSRLPHFTSPMLRVLLNRTGVSYIWLGDQLGGRPRSGPNLYAEMAETPFFRTGIKRLLEIAPRTRLSLMCAEQDPITCHRFLLIARHLAGLGIAVEHVHPDGSTEGQHDAEERLMARWRIKPDLLTTREERLAEAYRRQELRLRGEPA